jgi:hypothetical protein
MPGPSFVESAASAGVQLARGAAVLDANDVRGGERSVYLLGEQAA